MLVIPAHRPKTAAGFEEEFPSQIHSKPKEESYPSHPRYSCCAIFASQNYWSLRAVSRRTLAQPAIV